MTWRERAETAVVMETGGKAESERFRFTVWNCNIRQKTSDSKVNSAGGAWLAPFPDQVRALGVGAGGAPSPR